MRLLTVYALVSPTRGNFASQMTLLIIQILEAEVQLVDFLPPSAGCLFRVARVENGFAVATAQLRELGAKVFVRFVEGAGLVWGCAAGVGVLDGLDEG